MASERARGRLRAAADAPPAEARTYRALPWHDAMIAELVAISPGLVYDPAASERPFDSPLHVELRAIAAALRMAERAPTVALARVRPGGRPAALALRRGLLDGAVSVRAADADPPSPAASAALRKRLTEIAAIAEAAIRSIDSSRRFRDMPMAGNTTLYEAHDVPRLRALRDAMRVARALALRIRAVPASVERALQHTRAHVDKAAQRPLSALYERWVFLQVVKAVHGSLDPGTIAALFAGQSGTSPRDFDERTEHVRELPDGHTLRICFEPWILTRELAVAGEHGLYRGGDGAHAWRPDVVVQVERGERAGIPIVTSACIIDAKLASIPSRKLWDQVLKYAQIRASSDDAPVAQTLALALPALDDGGIAFYESLPPDPSARLLVLPLLPGQPTVAAERALAKLVAEVVR